LLVRPSVILTERPESEGSGDGLCSGSLSHVLGRVGVGGASVVKPIRKAKPPHPIPLHESTEVRGPEQILRLRRLLRRMTNLGPRDLLVRRETKRTSNPPFRHSSSPLLYTHETERFTTILRVRREGSPLGGDGQVSSATCRRPTAKQDSPRGGWKVLTGFAGLAAKLPCCDGSRKSSPVPPTTTRAPSSSWPRMAEPTAPAADGGDACRRRRTTSRIVSGPGDVIEPTNGIIGIGSGALRPSKARWIFPS